MNKKCFLSAIVMAFFMLTLIKIDAQAATITKTEGDITWSLTDNGLLTVSRASKPNANPVTIEQYADRIDKVVIKKGVTKIWDRAFYNSSMRSIAIPDSVTSIGEYAFYKCDNLTSIKIPTSVRTIGSGAFAGCNRLESVDLPPVKSIEDSLFADCSGMKSITIPLTVTVIKYGAFKDCHALTGISLPNSVVTIESYAFSGCSSMTKAILPARLKTISEYMFTHCKSLASIVIPASVTSIEDSAFYNCVSLESIIIPNSVRSLGTGVFRECENLTAVTVSDALLAASENVDGIFSNTPWLINRKRSVKGKAGDFSYVLSKSGVLTIKGSGEFFNYNNLYDGNGLLADLYTQVKTIVVDEGSGNVDLSSFCNTRDRYLNKDHTGKLEKIVNKSASVVTFKPDINNPYSSWFDNDGALEPIVTIRKGTAVKIRNNTRFTYKIAFNGNSASGGTMKEVTGEFDHSIYVPRNRFTKKGYIFKGFTYKFGGKTYTVDSGDEILLKKTDVKTKAVLKGITIMLTANWEKDTSVFPAGTNLVDKNGRKTGYVVTCSAPKNLTVKYVGTANDKKKNAVTVKDTVKDINGNTYKVTAIADRALKDSKTISRINVGKYVATIGSEALSGCTALTTAKLGESLTTIGDKAFFKTSISSLTLPAKTDHLGAQFIAKDSKLKTLTVKSEKITVKTLGDNAFGGFGQKVIVKAPKKMLGKYTDIFQKEGLNKNVKIQALK